MRVGLEDGRIATLDPGIARGKLQPYDVVRVKLTEGRGALRAQLRVKPTVQGAAQVLDNKDRPHPRDDRRLLLSNEPAQPGDAGRPASRARP